MTSPTREFLDAHLPQVRFSEKKVSRNARVIRTMLRHPVGRIVDSQGRTRAYWQLTDPPQPPTRVRPVPVKRSRRSR